MTKGAGWFQQWEQQYADDPEYITYGLLYEITEDICRAMEKQGINRRELARRLGVRPQYVSKFLNTPANTTVQQVVRFAQAVGLKVEMVLTPKILSVATAAPWETVQSGWPIASRNHRIHLLLEGGKDTGEASGLAA